LKFINSLFIEISDGGIDLDHSELYPRALNMPHYNFVILQTNGMPSSIYETHGTHIAGIIAAEMNNQGGMTGIAPQSRSASWVILIAVGIPLAIKDWLICFNIVQTQLTFKHIAGGSTAYILNRHLFLNRSLFQMRLNTEEQAKAW